LIIFFSLLSDKTLCNITKFVSVTFQNPFHTYEEFLNHILISFLQQHMLFESGKILLSLLKVGFTLS